MSRTDITANLFGGNQIIGKINNAFARLHAEKRARFEMQQPSTGRPRQMWFAIV